PDPSSPLFPSTTLFRSIRTGGVTAGVVWRQVRAKPVRRESRAAYLSQADGAVSEHGPVQIPPLLGQSQRTNPADGLRQARSANIDRKSTRLNSRHDQTS